MGLGGSIWAETLPFFIAVTSGGRGHAVAVSPSTLQDNTSKYFSGDGRWARPRQPSRLPNAYGAWGVDLGGNVAVFYRRHLRRPWPCCSS